jgi:hypothetical protein
MMQRQEVFEDWRSCGDNKVQAKIEPMGSMETEAYDVERCRSQTGT